MKNEGHYKTEISRLAKKLHRIRIKCEMYQVSNLGRKKQLSSWSSFFQFLIKEGRVSKEELSAYSPRKIKIK